jgi:hypothetical protein
MAAEQPAACRRPLNGKFVADTIIDGTAAEVSIFDRDARAGSRARVAGSFTFLSTGDVLFDYWADPTGREARVAPIDADGNPDEALTALVYAGATLEHPLAENGAIGEVKVMLTETHPKICENLGAIGFDFYDVPDKPSLDGGNQRRWAEDLPGVSAEKIVYAHGDHFEPLPAEFIKTPAAV